MQVAKFVFHGQTWFFSPKPPWNLFKTTKQRETVPTLHMQLDCVKEPWMALLLLDMSQKRPQMAPKAPKFVHIGHCELQNKKR